MSTRTAVTIVGGVIGAYFGYPQLGLMAGALIGGQIDPVQIPGPKIGEIPNQTSADGVNRPLIWGTTWVYGNVIQQGPIIKVEDDSGEGKGGEPEQGPGDRVYRTFAIRIAGPIAAVLRVWQDNKLVYDIRNGSAMIAESEKWMENKVLYLGDEEQLPDPNLVAINSDTHSYRGTSYMVFIEEDLTPRGGSISQYRWEIASESVPPEIGDYIAVVTIPTPTGPYYPSVQIYRDYSNSHEGKVVAGTYTDNVLSPNGTDSYSLLVLGESGETVETDTVVLTGSNWSTYAPGASSIVPRGYYGPYAFSMTASNAGDNALLSANGILIATLKPTSLYANDWYQGVTGATYQQDGRRLAFSATHVYFGVVTTDGVNLNNFCRYSLGSGSFPSVADIVLTNICTTPGTQFFVNLSNDGFIRIINDVRDMKTYDLDMNLLSTVNVSSFTSGSSFHGFGVDEDNAVFVFGSPSPRMEVRKLDDLTTLVKSDVRSSFIKGNNTRVAFTDTRLYIQCEDEVVVYENIKSRDGVPAVLGDIVADIHYRCGIDSSMYDVSELTDLVDGFSAAGDYTGADVITELRKVYFFDKSEHDKKLYYPKRGLPVVETITIDDMTEVPDRSQREQAVEVPKKLNLKYQHAASGYAPVKSTFSSSSTDVLTEGETSIDTSVVMNEDQAAQTVQKMFKVARTDIGGEMTVSVPMNIGSKYVPGNCLGVFLRGIVTRERIERIDFNGSSYKLSLRPDRQSAYTSTLTGIPIPPPTLPPSTIIGQTELAVLDISARTETEDDLSYLVAVTGSLPPWYGARYRRSLDGGANYENVRDIKVASIMGEITADVPEAPESFTDYTNTVNVILYRDGQLIESITNNQFLSEGGAFALEKADGSWEIMQYRDAVEESDGSFTLSVLHRGQLNSGPSDHTTGARLVMLDRPSHIPASSTWIGQDITHQAVSLGESVDDTTNAFTETFVGRSQLEWPVSSLELTRNVDDVSATWAPRYRFGSANSPIASINMTGFRVTIDDGSLTDTFDLPLNTPYFTNYDASAFGPSVTVSVQALNRITGAGPATSGTV